LGCSGGQSNKESGSVGIPIGVFEECRNAIKLTKELLSFFGPDNSFDFVDFCAFLRKNISTDSQRTHEQQVDCEWIAVTKLEFDRLH
jgi:hypothetical protein